MTKNGHGGSRPGAGRKSTGHTKKSYTITLPLEVALDLEKKAEQCNQKVHRYIRDFIISAGQYNIESDNDQTDNFLIAAEESKPYTKK